jgi:hypothetical protein
MQRSSTLETLPLGADAQRAAVDNARQSLGSIILGKNDEISLALACLLARGHLLIEDLPGLGKTCRPILWAFRFSSSSKANLSFNRDRFSRNWYWPMK